MVKKKHEIIGLSKLIDIIEDNFYYGLFLIFGVIAWIGICGSISAGEIPSRLYTLLGVILLVILETLFIGMLFLFRSDKERLTIPAIIALKILCLIYSSIFLVLAGLIYGIIYLITLINQTHLLIALGVIMFFAVNVLIAKAIGVKK